MKYRGVHALPSSVALWLEQQLEDRGIDSVVYTRYILSLFKDDSIDLNDLPQLPKGRKKGANTSWESCNLEELKRTAAIDCLNRASYQEAIEIESLVDELCIKLKEADSEGDRYLKEKGNSDHLYSPDLSVTASDLANKYYSIFPALSKEVQDTVHSSVWCPRNFRVSAHKRKGEDSTDCCSALLLKTCKSQENKENVSIVRGRMRSRSTVKQSAGGSTHRVRSSAKSLDRKDDEVVVRFVRNEMKGRKCLGGLFGDEREAKLSRTPGRKEKLEISELDQQDLPMDFQQLLQSPDDSSLYRQPKQNLPPPNFIQCGTNITSSIWSEPSEKMEEDDVPLQWETPKWSDARSSILSTAFKLPFAYEKDVESTALAFGKDGSFFSIFGSTTLLNHTKTSGFAEVLPGTHHEKKKVTVTHALPDPQEEDLLTSMKTHFRPIKDEGSKIGYKDGSSFVISANFEQIKYRRSESGAFYLGSDSKYFEFKRPGSSSAFVPKFKVCQSEKFCQTEDFPPEVVHSGGDEEEEELISTSAPEEFFFPGDAQLAEDMVNSVDDEEIHPTIQLSGWVTTWPVSSAIWSNDTLNNTNSWMLNGVSKPFRTGSIGEHNEHYMRLRNELTEEGEELLSDLSSIHLFLDPDRMDDSNPHIQAHYPQNMHYHPCTVQNGNLTNEPFF